MKFLIILYSLVLAFSGLGMIVLAMGSPHHLDTSLLLSIWATAISFPVTVYLLNSSSHSMNRHIINIFFLAMNCTIFYYWFYDMVKGSDDGFKDAVAGLLIPLSGLLLSIFFLLISLKRIKKVEKS